MCVARTAARRRKQIRLDPRYKKPQMTVARGLQGRSKALALTTRTLNLAGKGTTFVG